MRIRRDRRELGARTRRPPSLVRLIFLLLMVLGLIWFLSQYT